MKTWISLFATLPVLVGCQTLTVETDQHARITDPTDASRASLQEALKSFLHVDVVIADDALTTSSLLVIERSQPRTIEGSPAQGRTMELPFQFRLVAHGDTCVLIDLRDDARRELENTICEPEE